MTNFLKQQQQQQRVSVVIALALLVGTTPIFATDITNEQQGKIDPAHPVLRRSDEAKGFDQSLRTIKERVFIPSVNLPGSPADLFHPDRFQFYTLDKSGQVVTKQMTRQEIQSLIAAGGGHLSAMAAAAAAVEQQPQKAGEVPSGGTRVADVVQNVQNVLKSELSKPVPTMIAPPPTIPGHANSEWSNILPSILAAGDVETQTTQTDIQQQEVQKIITTPSPPRDSSQYGVITERPMIQVPVITVEEKLPIQNNSSQNSKITHNGMLNKTNNELNKPIFQMLNTISADTLKDNYNKTLAEQNTSGRDEIVNNDAGIEGHTTSIISETHSTSIKIEKTGQVEVKNNTYDHNKKEEILTNPTNGLGLVKPVLLNNIFINENISSTPFTENFLQSTTMENNVQLNSSSTQNQLAIIKTTSNELVAIADREKLNAEEESLGAAPSSQIQDNTTIKSIITTIIPATSSTNASNFSSTMENNTVSGALFNELEHSLSSMISQISQSMSEPLAIKTTANSSLPADNGGLQGIFATDEATETKIQLGAENTDETPIVRIDIMEVKPQPTSETNSLKLNISQNLNNESPVVRIQLATDTISEINHLIDSFTFNNNNNNNKSLPEIAPLNLPSRHNIHPNNVTSGLIAGFTNNNDDNIMKKEQIIVPADFVKLSEDEEKMDLIETTPLNDDNYNISVDMLMQKINFDQLPIINQQKIRKPSNVTWLTIKHNRTGIADISLHQTSNFSSPFKFQEGNEKNDENSWTKLVDMNSNESIATILRPGGHEENLTDNIDFSTEVAASHVFIPAKIQLDDLPIVEKVNKHVTMKIDNSTSNKSHINEHHAMVTPHSPMNNLYENDPYKKLGEIVKPIIKLVDNNISQILNYSNKTLKIKDQKKDSSMEKMPLMTSVIDLELANNESSIMTGITPTRKPDTTVQTSTSTIRDDYKNNNSNNNAEQFQKWTLIPQQASKIGVHAKRPINNEPVAFHADGPLRNQQETVALLNHSRTVDGLDSSVKNLEPDVSYFSNICNDLAFSLWNATNEGLSVSRSLVISPFGITSMLAMIFLGARGTTSDQMNNILKLDDVASFNPHLIFQNVTDSVGLARKQGIANAAFVRELFADKIKVRKLLPFYKEQAQQFYDGVVAEVNFATISDLARRRTNLMIRKQTGGRIKDFVRGNIVPLRSPLAALSANVYQTDCNSSDASSDGRDGELYFAVSPAVRQRKLVPVPSTVWKSGVLAGYEPSLDATAIALGGSDKLVSTIFIIPGQQGFTAPGDSLELLEERLIRRATYDGLWNKLLKVIIPRPGFELQVPKFSHRSVINATAALKRIGLQQLFGHHADLKGINGIGSDLHLTDVLQMNLFSTCGDENILSGRHHVEVYPTNSPRDIRTLAHQLNKIPLNNKDNHSDQLSTIKLTTTKINQDSDKPRLKLDRPFLYFVRHNPTGLILHMGRFNPRLLP